MVDKEKNKTDEELYFEAGRISFKALQEGAKKIKKGVKLVDVAEYAEKLIKDEGADWAFPANISQNERAAHYTPSFDDESVFGDDIVKLDVGAHIDGFVGDNALTVDLTGKYKNLVKATEDALKNAIKTVAPGVKSTEVGAVIQETIEKAGFKPVENLSGHVLRKNLLHSGLSMPNVSWGNEFVIEEGMAIAIEPFASTGRGRVTDERLVEIFSLRKPVPLRNTEARKILNYVQENYPYFPFAERWLNSVSSGFKFKAALKELIQKGVFETHPVLRDEGLVAQTERTVLVTKDGCEVTTK
ncbi:MAG: type II methionyl aminopeptidase [Candidatus Diapherotrites archaeon]|nr:type II methionyl aminopeptidase [Candidatus Diapherotrites archaeon]